MKEKQKYNALQNTLWALGWVWRTDKRVPVLAVFCIVFAGETWPSFMPDRRSLPGWRAALPSVRCCKRFCCSPACCSCVLAPCST